jgi:hypothetical protein
MDVESSVADESGGTAASGPGRHRLASPWKNLLEF